MPNLTPAQVIDLDNAEAEQTDDDGAEPATLGEPFALATGVELLDAEGRIPGCIVSARCDCGSAFKFSLLGAGYKACPGCGTQYTHALLIAPADDREIVDQFLEIIDSEPAEDDNDDEDQRDDLAGDDDHGDDDQGNDDATTNRQVHGRIDPYNSADDT